MKNLMPREYLIEIFELLAYDICDRTKSMMLSQKKIDDTYNEISCAITNITYTINNAGFLQLGLMDIVLRREIISLCESLETLRNTLLEATNDLIRNTTVALTEVNLDVLQGYMGGVEKSKLSMINSLHDLKETKLLLSSRVYVSSQPK